MARFDDYHRTVVGYHGTGLTAALRIVNRLEGFRQSQRDFDWLGDGTYFWEYAPKLVLTFAKIRQRQYRKLDCEVFNFAYKVIEDSEPNLKVDTARGVYVPTDGTKRIWDGSWISRDTHIQICVRNSASILGTWLHYPTGLEVNDVCKAIQAGPAVLEPEDQEGEGVTEPDVEIEED